MGEKTLNEGFGVFVSSSALAVVDGSALTATTGRAGVELEMSFETVGIDDILE